MKKISKLIVPVLCLILVSSQLTGCSSGASSASPGSDTPKENVPGTSDESANNPEESSTENETDKSGNNNDAGDKEVAADNMAANADDTSGKDSQVTDQNKANDESADDPEDYYKENSDEVFAEMSEWTFTFSSGAGGWSTQLFVKPDGTFSGVYSDSEMGSTGPGYDNGTVYQCDFTGKFSDYVRSAGPRMHSLNIESIEFANEPDTEEIRDNILYKYTTPYGIEGLEKVTDYSPLVFFEAGAVTSVFNEDELSWVSPRHFGCNLGEDWDYVEDIPEELPYAVLLNTEDGYAFYGENISEKNKTFLINKISIPGLKNTELTINDDGTYYSVDENSDGTFKIINTCFKAKKSYDTYAEGDALVKDSLNKIYGKDAPDSNSLYITTPKEAYSMQYSEMAVNGEYTVSAFWKPKGHDEDYTLHRNGRFLALNEYDSDSSYVYAYIIESEDHPDNTTLPDAGFSNFYITSLTLTGNNERISSATEGKEAVREIACDMRLSGKEAVAARKLVMVGINNEELIKKYHLEDADFDNDYEIVFLEDDYKPYKLANSSLTPFYMQFPEDNFHRMYQAFELDKYINRSGNDPTNSCLMYLYLNEDDEVVYGYEIYTP